MLHKCSDSAVIRPKKVVMDPDSVSLKLQDSANTEYFISPHQ